MITENANKERLLSREAASDIDANLCCVDAGANKVDICPAGGRATSISRYKAAAGTAASQQYGPSDTIVKAGGIIADNGEVVVGDDGKVIAKADGSVGDWVIGALTNGTSAAADGDLVTVRLDPPGQYKIPA